MAAGTPARKSTRAIPWLILAAAIAHCTVAVIASPSWGAIAAGGVWNSVSADNYAAMTTLWFAAAGLALLGLGLLARRAVMDTGSLPTETGWILLCIGIPVSLLEPLSGGWLLAGIGLLSVVSGAQRPPVVDDPADRDRRRVATDP